MIISGGSGANLFATASYHPTNINIYGVSEEKLQLLLHGNATKSFWSALFFHALLFLFQRLQII